MKLPNGIQLIKVYDPGLIKGPASFNRRTRTIYVNGPMFDPLAQFEQDFIVCHELGHLHTHDEEEADSIAFDMYVRNEGYSPSQAVEAVNNTLSFTKPEHSRRLMRIIKQAALYDLGVNKNMNAKKVLNMYNLEALTDEDIAHLKKYSTEMGVSEDDFDNFLGFSEKAKANREARQAARAQRKSDRNERKNIRTNARAGLLAAKAEGIKSGTYQNPIGGILGTVADTAKNIFGNNESPADENLTEDEMYAMEEAARKKKTTTYIIIGVVVVVVAVVLFVVLSKKKK